MNKEIQEEIHNLSDERKFQLICSCIKLIGDEYGLTDKNVLEWWKKTNFDIDKPLPRFEEGD